MQSKPHDAEHGPRGSIDEEADADGISDVELDADVHELADGELVSDTEADRLVDDEADPAGNIDDEADADGVSDVELDADVHELADGELVSDTEADRLVDDDIDDEADADAVSDVELESDACNARGQPEGDGATGARSLDTEDATAVSYTLCSGGRTTGASPIATVTPADHRASLGLSTRNANIVDGVDTYARPYRPTTGADVNTAPSGLEKLETRPPPGPESSTNTTPTVSVTTNTSDAASDMDTGVSCASYCHTSVGVDGPADTTSLYT
jgi:hypothetical protein